MPDDPSVTRIVFARELRAHARTFVVWAVPLAGMVALVCALQPSLANGPLAAKIASMPETMRRALGLEIVDFHRPAAYLAANFLTFTIGCSLFAGLLGASIIAKEEVLHTAELLYAQPTSRTRILLGKAAAATTFAIGLPALLALVATPLLAAVSDRPLEPASIAALFAGVAALAICFAGCGMLVAAVVPDPRSATGGVLGVVFGTFFLGIVAALSGTVAWLRWLSPFKWIEPSSILARGLDPKAVIALLGVGVTCGAIAIARYRRRDLRT